MAAQIVASQHFNNAWTPRAGLAATANRIRNMFPLPDRIRRRGFKGAILTERYDDAPRGSYTRLATALGLGTVSMTTVGMAFGNHSGWGGNHFGHRAFGHPFHNRFRFHKTLIVPYAYYDYGYPTDAFGDYPPPVAGVVAPPSPPPTACHRNVERFTVPSEGGGTRQITIINCP